MTTPHYDIVVIGAGINGAGIAQAAAAQGHSTLILESSAIASGTSSRSSKLVHGGLRYLESGQFKLVRESLHERAVLLKNAPDLVKLRPHYIPIYTCTKRRPLTLHMGLSLYSLLGGFNKDVRYSTLPKSSWNQLDGLKTKGLQTVFQYWDAQTDDVALTHAVIKSAQQYGAELLLPASFKKASLQGKQWNIHYQHKGEKYCTANVLVNAAGPWVSTIDQQVSPCPPSVACELVQGCHITIEANIKAGIFYLEAPQDGRAVFVIPWKGKMMVGTTENSYHGNPREVKPLESEVTYLKEITKHYFPSLANQPLVSSFAGLRVLPSGSGLAFGRSRETLLNQPRICEQRLVSVYGGKLTSYRATAEKCLEKLQPLLPSVKIPRDTKNIRLDNE